MDLSGCFSRQVDPRLLTEPENVIVFAELIPPQLRTDLHHHTVTRFHDPLLQGNVPVPGTHRTADVRTRDIHHARTLIIVRIFCLALIKRRSHRKRLKRRSRFIGKRNTEVRPHRHQILRRCRLVHPFDLLLRVHGRQISRVVQIVRILGRHS